MQKLLTILLFFVATLTLSGQKFRTTSNRALKSYNEGKEAYDFFDFSSAEANLLQAVSIDPEFTDALMLLAQLYSDIEKYAESAKYYRLGIARDSLYFTPAFYSLARAEMAIGDYKAAKKNLLRYLATGPSSEELLKKTVKSIADCDFSIVEIETPVDFKPENLGPAINTDFDEYWPSVTADGTTLIFTRQLETGRGGFPGVMKNEDFYISRYSNGEWAKAVTAGQPLNTANNEGAQSLSSDGTYMFFTACSRIDGYGRCDIYYTRLKGSSWSEPVNIGAPVNTQFWDAQPSVSADGRRLYFVSNRPGGEGGMDIWYSDRTDDGRWDTPVNPGPIINSSGDEMSPFIHFDGKTLYFSSNGRPSFGGHDLYFTKKDDKGSWSEPKNLGYPINTFSDEMGLVINAPGEKAFFSSRRERSKGKDIYSFDLPSDLRPGAVSYLKGTVYDRITGRLLMASFEVTDLMKEETPLSGTTGIDGTFLACIIPGINYAINVSKPGYLFYSENIMLDIEYREPEPFIKDIFLSPLIVGETMSLYNIFFDTDSWEIRKESRIELDMLYSLLLDNKGVSIEVGGHTDSTGTETYNQTLSEKRALAVRNYLIKKGIAAKRITSKGYGMNSPVGENLTEAGRRVNRRTDISITEIAGN